MSDLRFLQTQVADLEDLAAEVAESPVLLRQVQARLQAAQRLLNQARAGDQMLIAPEPLVLPPSALFLSGDGVIEGKSAGEDEGVRPSLAGETLLQFERVFIEQSLHDERLAARAQGRQRRERGTPPPELLLTSTPKGSFGMVFVPKANVEGDQLSGRAESLKRTTELLVELGNAEPDAFEEVLGKVPRTALAPLKLLFAALARHHTAVRVVTAGSLSRTISAESVRATAERLDREVKEWRQPEEGTFRGITLDSLQFDFTNEKQEKISGTVSDDLPEEALEKLHDLVNRRCRIMVRITAIQYSNGNVRKEYILEGFEPLD